MNAQLVDPVPAPQRALSAQAMAYASVGNVAVGFDILGP